jgi:hypothetical protein
MHVTSKQPGLALLASSLVAATPMEILLTKRDASTYEVNAVCTA